MRLYILAFLALTLSGCAASLKFIDRETGAVHLGLTGSTASQSGELTASIEGEDYKGDWIYSPRGGGYSLGTSTATAYGPGGVATGTGTSFGVVESASGNGMINMWGSNESYVRCVFTFNSFSDTGIGECVRNDGKYFDLTIRK
jgi:hypothetical protein